MEMLAGGEPGRRVAGRGLDPESWIGVEIGLRRIVFAEREIKHSQIRSVGVVRVVQAAGDNLPVLNPRRKSGCGFCATAGSHDRTIALSNEVTNADAVTNRILMRLIIGCLLPVK